MQKAAAFYNYAFNPAFSQSASISKQATGTAHSTAKSPVRSSSRRRIGEKRGDVKIMTPAPIRTIWSCTSGFNN